jgi:hypothetical protein
MRLSLTALHKWKLTKLTHYVRCEVLTVLNMKTLSSGMWRHEGGSSASILRVKEMNEMTGNSLNNKKKTVTINNNKQVRLK